MINLQMPPSLNHIYRRRKQGGMYMTDEGKRWKEYAAWEIKGAGKFERVKVAVRFYFPDHKVKDLDGLLKLLSDAIVMAGVIKDDRWEILNEWSIQGFLDREKPRVELEITEI